MLPERDGEPFDNLPARHRVISRRESCAKHGVPLDEPVECRLEGGHIDRFVKSQSEAEIVGIALGVKLLQPPEPFLAR